MSNWFKLQDGAVDIAVRLTPGASVDAFDGLVEDSAGVFRLKARVRAVAENNKANRAIEKLIAKRLRIGKTSVRVISGDTSRSKIIRIEGDPDDLTTGLKDLVRTG
ncbi:MAG: DUF167 domain-containing protein [Hoeflea sp.]|nr:DUF167 family protein [Hoeflea sp.]MBU4531853.1 DUF167 domain-containing protein [Alphaproteobacteria bacterium]MBU4544709.1 DUF167 domain-containing protein [Alphaproteobacteria bacterium]MBU4552940.1 DUF167 domain-containing protein [Alphaproteobacteria bacterium]MBV1725129.1 DUF167 domain-containing protein [Hoeflea sp.]MBV1761149.1 DUF167 domain-containing protein [Hoeflea sp.]